MRRLVAMTEDACSASAAAVMSSMKRTAAVNDPVFNACASALEEAEYAAEMDARYRRMIAGAFVEHDLMEE